MQPLTTLEEIKREVQPIATGSLSPGQKQKIDLLTQRTWEFLDELRELVPDGSDKTHAMRLVIDAKMWCIQTITHTPEKVAEAKATNLGFGKVSQSTRSSDGKAQPDGKKENQAQNPSQKN